MSKPGSSPPAVLLTGGAGYIGSHIALLLREHGWRTIVLDDLSTGSRQALSPDAVFYECDIDNRELLVKIFSEHRIIAVLHLAAVSTIPASIKDPQRCERVNYEATRKLIEVCLTYGCAKFIFASTSAVYDESVEPPFSEDAALATANLYAETKLKAEQAITDCDKLDHVIFRYFNVGGADQRIGNHKKHDTTLIKSVLESAAGKREPPFNLYGTDYETDDGTCVRDYIHVMDIARAHLLALDYLLGGGKSDVFNLGLGKGFSVRQVIDAAKRITGINFPVRQMPRREGDMPSAYSDTGKVRRVLGFIPETLTLEEIIKTSWAWENREYGSASQLDRG